MQKVALTSLAGTSIEWYDFFLYGASAALIFPTVFFGETTPSTALILSLLTFAAGFIARCLHRDWIRPQPSRVLCYSAASDRAAEPSGPRTGHRV